MNMNWARFAQRWVIAVAVWMPVSAGVHADTLEDSIDLIVRSEVTIQQPAAVVWPRILDFASWKSIKSLQRVSGEADQEGDLRLLTPCGATDAGSYFLRIVKVVPEERLVVKLITKDGKTSMGYGAFELHETQSRTKVIYDTYIQYPAHGLPPSERQATVRKFKEMLKLKVDQEHLVLKDLAEGRTQPKAAQC